MIPALAIIGPSGSGKTALIEALVSELSGRNWRVATIKRHHGPLEVDHEGKEDLRHKRAGAAAVVIATPGGTAVIRDETEEPESAEIIERYLFDADIVFASGYKTLRIPQIAIVDKGNPESIEIAGEELVISIVSKDDIDISGLTCFKPDEISRLADFVEERYLKKERSAGIHLMVDGKRVPMKPFVRDLVDSVIRGMVGTFKGTENAKKIAIFLDRSV